MKGSEYAVLYRWSLDDLHSFVNLQIARAQRMLGSPLAAQFYMDLADQSLEPAERRRYYIAAYREVRLATERLPSANGMFDEILSPQDIKNELEALKASYDVVNQTARIRPSWAAHYEEFLKFYEANKDPGWFTSSQATMDHIRERGRRLEEWKKQLIADGVPIHEPEKKPPAAPVKDALDSATLAIALGLGGWLLLRSSK